MWAWGLTAEERPTVFKQHSAEVTGVALQPVGDFFCSCGRDGAWCFYDIAAARAVQTVACGLEGVCCEGV